MASVILQRDEKENKGKKKLCRRQFISQPSSCAIPIKRRIQEDSNNTMKGLLVYKEALHALL